MTDSQDDDIHGSLTERRRKHSPPSAPPSPDAMDSELKLSRKREREVSLEPATTPRAALDTDPLLQEQKGAPAKKNRRRLDTTREEEDGQSGSRSHSGSPPISVSPPHEMKMRVRQISQGVEDINWQNMNATMPDNNFDAESAAMRFVANKDPHAEAEQLEDIKVDDEEPSPPGSLDGSELSRSVTDAQGDGTVLSIGPAIRGDGPSHFRSDSESGDKGLKRKYLERGTSQGPQETGDDSRYPSDPLKRLRDEADHDDNPRETKRPSPPPAESTPSPPSPKMPKLSGFMAYASTSSPFAHVHGKNLFASSKSSSTPIPTSGPTKHTPSTPISALTQKLGESSTSTPTGVKRTGFEAFASSSSPFTSATRSKSPILGSTSKLGRTKSPTRRANSVNSNPFASYVGGVQGFAIPAPKRARAGSPGGSSSRSSLERYTGVGATESNSGPESGSEDERNGSSTSFGARLRAGTDASEKVKRESDVLIVTKQELITGEEDEMAIASARGKLFTLEGNQWKERGTGLLKLNVKQEDGSGARLVMRKEAVFTVLLNVVLFPGMRCVLAQDPRYLRFSLIEDGVTTHYNLRVSNAKVAQDLLDKINNSIPSI